MKQYNTIVYIGRFQPFHLGHYETIKKALTLASQVIVLVGSVDKPRTIKDPFNYKEREDMIRKSFPSGWSDKDLSSWVDICPIEDSLYDDNAWAARVQDLVGERTVWHKMPGGVGIIGLEKDESSFYLKMFPQWKSVDMGNFLGINASDIRDEYFSKTGIKKELVPASSYEFLVEFALNPDGRYLGLCKEWRFIRDYKNAWSATPYPPTFVTVDAVVFYCGHVLLVKRKAEPGKGLWALPGGFIGQNERIKDACIRELYEETKLGLYPSELAGMYKSNHVFDHPYRSLRGRTITHAYHYQTILPFERLKGELPKVKGSDDAEVAKWIPLGDAMRMGEMLFEDHLSVIRSYV